MAPHRVAPAGQRHGGVDEAAEQELCGGLEGHGVPLDAHLGKPRRGAVLDADTGHVPRRQLVQRGVLAWAGLEDKRQDVKCGAARGRLPAQRADDKVREGLVGGVAEERLVGALVAREAHELVVPHAGAVGGAGGTGSEGAEVGHGAAVL